MIVKNYYNKSYPIVTNYFPLFEIVLFQLALIEIYWLLQLLVSQSGLITMIDGFTDSNA